MIRVSVVYRAARENAGPVPHNRYRGTIEEVAGKPREPRAHLGRGHPCQYGRRAHARYGIPENLQGVIVDQRVIADQLESGEKLLYLFFDQFVHQPDVYFEVEDGTPLGLIAFKGNLNSDFLWKNKALPLPD